MELVKQKSSIATISSERLLTKYGPKSCLKHSNKVRTMDLAMNNPHGISLGTFHREKGRDFTEGLLMGWLVYLNDILNLNKPMTEDQIEMCAIELVNDYYMLKTTDLTLLFKRIIAGSYGEFYESLSTPKILGFFKSYFEERCELAEEQTQRKHLDLKSIDTFNISKNVRRIVQSNSKRFQ